MSTNGVIGKDNGLPWRLPKDMKHFMSSTMGKPVIMGRKTFESMKSPLPGRTNIVLTRDQNWSRDGVFVALDLSKAFELGRIAAEQDNLSEFFVIGGSSLYEEAMPHATRLYVTQIEAVIEGDVSFPDINWAGWSSIRNERHEIDEDHAHAFTIGEFVRKK
jgi:dihydrofolate reductase